MRCVVIPEAVETIVACPGTVSLSGWMRDFSTWPKAFEPLGYLHEGFGDGGLKLWVALQEATAKAPFLTFAGHSLGAAVAQNLAAWAALDNRRFRVITWGTPRSIVFWNWSFQKLIGKAAQAVSYVNAGDRVPDVPLRPLWKHTLDRTSLPGPSYLESRQDHAMSLYAARTPDVGKL